MAGATSLSHGVSFSRNVTTRRAFKNTASVSSNAPNPRFLGERTFPAQTRASSASVPPLPFGGFGYAGGGPDAPSVDVGVNENITSS